MVAGYHPVELRLQAMGHWFEPSCAHEFRFAGLYSDFKYSFGESAGESDAIGFLALPEWRFNKPVAELTSSGLIPPRNRCGTRSGDEVNVCWS